MPPRHNYDNITNKNRTQLLQRGRNLGMYIVNGRLWGDSYGRYTHSSSLGSSTVEYFLSLTSTQRLLGVSVDWLWTLSDHSRITLYLNRALLSHEASKPKVRNNIKTCYRWKESSVELYQQTIRQQQIQSILDNFLDKMFHCNSDGLNLAVENLNSIFDLSASLSNLNISSRQLN